jgi:hypothetical protein
LVVVVTESSISSRCQDGQPHTQVFLSLFVEKETNGAISIYFFICARHGMEKRRVRRVVVVVVIRDIITSAGQREKQEILRYLFGLMFLLFSIDSITSYQVESRERNVNSK